MSKKGMTTGAVGRFVRLGGLAGRVGASVVGNKVMDIARSDPERQVQKTENLIRNAVRIAETLGELKGAAMKIGQMLSLHEGLMPAEVAEVLRSLQKEAPPVPEEVIDLEIRGALPNYDEIFDSLELNAFAAASIGQVHRGVLRDGREVAVKIQYPLIDHIVRADLKNLKRVMQSLVALVMEVDFEPIWGEVRDRLLEELDYTNEAANMRRMAKLHADVPEIVIPRVVEEASTRNVLTMEYVGGIPPTEACSNQMAQQLRDKWGAVLVQLMLRGLFEHRFLHADPNLANFAFLDDGRVIVYDFGCVKEVPENIAVGYAELWMAGLEKRGDLVPEILGRIGVATADGTLLPVELVEPYIDVLSPILRAEPPFTFGEDDEIYSELFALGMSNWSKAMDIRFPQDVIFIDRALGGHFGNLCRLNATGPWRDIMLEFAGHLGP
ncbi:MAG: AarF/ABC1/UbiB kinase family protein [bacterium]|nr:AarF/ABC1/UbiB kinase family protein [bacterium]